MFLDPTYLLMMAPAFALSAWAQFKVKSTFNHYSKFGVRSGMTGAQAAAAVVRAGGVTGVTVERHQGFLSDHYDPRAKSLRLSPEVHDGRSISSIAVAAHEAGHAIQDATGYAPLAIRSQLVPITNIGARFWIWPFIAGAIFSSQGGGSFGNTLIWIGIILFSATVLFQIVTLPTEFNASNRAKAVLANTGIVATQDEAEGVSKVLRAAAMTYVAAAIAQIMQLIYLLMRARD